MATKEDLDRDLAEFLRRETEAERDGFTKRALHSGMKALDSRFADHEKKDDDRHYEAMQAIYGMQARISAVESQTQANKSDISELKPMARDAMTSVHDLEAETLTSKLADERAHAKEWKARVWQVAFWATTGAITLLVAYLLGRAGISVH